MEDAFDLERFVTAQAAVFPQVLAELRAGEKRGHWIWFIFPQMKGLGRSPQSEFYGIGSLEEAAAYWQHPILGPRLEQCTRLVNQVEGRTIHRDPRPSRRPQVSLLDDALCARCAGAHRLQ